MLVAFHTVADAANAQEPASAAAWHDAEMGVCAVVSARVSATLLEHGLGASACQVALETLRSHLMVHRGVMEELTAHPGEATRQRVQQTLRTAFSLASRELLNLARRRRVDLRVSLDLVWVAGAECLVGHIGDGRVYLVRKGLVHRLTQDHVEEDPNTPMGGLAPRLSNALGQAAHVHPETLALMLADGDRVLLATASAHRVMDDLRLREVVSDPSMDGVTARLLGGARTAGALEDLAAGLVDLGGGPRAKAGSSRMETLARIPMFAYCTERELLAIAGVTRPARYRAGSLVFREGDPGQEMYLLVAGQLVVVKDGQTIAQLSPGANFGEMALLDEPHRSATVRAQDDSEVLVITRDAFFSLLRRDPPLAVKVLWNMLLRISANLRATSEALAHRPADHKR